jgi:hypothetical protein
MAYSGTYAPKHAEKYLGDASRVFYRSLWERRVMKYCDDTPGILKWSSEEIIVPYIKPTDGHTHRYFVDFYLEVAAVGGGVKKFLIEVKPKAQVKEPVRRKKTRKFIKEVVTYSVNQAKWEAATKYAAARGWVFLILTEDHLFGKGRRL